MRLDMRLMNSEKKSLGKFAWGAVFIFSGVVIGIIGIFIIALSRQPDINEIKEDRLQYTIKYIKSEQESLGIDCHSLKKNIQDFMADEIQPVLKAHRNSQGLNSNFSQGAQKRMEQIRDSYFACGRLYRTAQNVQWDGFKDVDFTVKLDTEIILLNVLIGYGEVGKSCDGICPDGNYNSIEIAVEKIEGQLNSQSSN